MFYTLKNFNYYHKLFLKLQKINMYQFYLWDCDTTALLAEKLFYAIYAKCGIGKIMPNSRYIPVYFDRNISNFRDSLGDGIIEKDCFYSRHQIGYFDDGAVTDLLYGYYLESEYWDYIYVNLYARELEDYRGENTTKTIIRKCINERIGFVLIDEETMDRSEIETYSGFFNLYEDNYEWSQIISSRLLTKFYKNIDKFKSDKDRKLVTCIQEAVSLIKEAMSTSYSKIFLLDKDLERALFVYICSPDNNDIMGEFTIGPGIMLAGYLIDCAIILLDKKHGFLPEELNLIK